MCDMQQASPLSLHDDNSSRAFWHPYAGFFWQDIIPIAALLRTTSKLYSGHREITASLQIQKALSGIVSEGLGHAAYERRCRTVLFCDYHRPGRLVIDTMANIRLLRDGLTGMFPAAAKQRNLNESTPLETPAARTASVAKSPRQRSAVTNGKRAFVDGDGNAAWTRRWRDLVSAHVSDLGGTDILSEAQSSLCRRVATIEIELEQLEGKLSKGEAVDLDAYTRAAGHLRRILELLGLERRSKDLTPSVDALSRARCCRRKGERRMTPTVSIRKVSPTRRCSARVLNGRELGCLARAADRQHGRGVDRRRARDFPN